MKVTLTDGENYTLGFRHYYAQEVFATVINGEIDVFSSEIQVDRYPVATECFLRGYNHDGTPYQYARAISMKHPDDNPNKEIARTVALQRMVSTLINADDRQLVLEAYANRKESKKGQ